MAWNKAEFEKQMKALVQTVEGEGHKVTRVTALATSQAAVHGTPVDKGQARGGWLMSHGSPSGQVDEKRSDKKGDRTLARINSVIGNYKIGEEMYLENNVNHIGYLDDGSSTQAPLGITDQAVAAGTKAAQEALSKLKV